MNRTDIINFLIKNNSYDKYLEIGCSKDSNFNKIPCSTKIGVDPLKGGTHRMTSDDFFKINTSNFDIIFIDGLHHDNQVYNDIYNSLNCLLPNGTIVVHDCNPPNYRSQDVPRSFFQRHWNGDVWKAWVRIRCHDENLHMVVVDIDEGCGIIKKGKQKKIDRLTCDFNEFEKDKKYYLNLVSPEDFLKTIQPPR